MVPTEQPSDRLKIFQESVREYYLLTSKRLKSFKSITARGNDTVFSEDVSVALYSGLQCLVI